MDVARLDGPLQDDAVLAIGRIGDKRGLLVLADLQHRATQSPAVDRRGDLPARKQLQFAPRLPDGDAQVRNRESRLSGAAARAAGGIVGARRGR